MGSLRLVSAVAAAGLGLAALLASSVVVAEAQTLQVLAKTGDVTSGGPIDDIDRPVATSSRRIIFTADLGPGAITKHALLISDGSSLSVLAEAPLTLGSEGIEVSDFRGGTYPVLTPAGDVLFNADFELIGGGGGDEGIFLYRQGSGATASVVLDGDPVPNGNGQLGVENNNHPAVAAGDHIAFNATVFNAVGGLGNGSGIFRSAGTGALTRIARTGQVPPLGSSFFEGFSWPSVNASGEVAFAGLLDSGPDGIYKGSGGNLTTIALVGQEAYPGWDIQNLLPTGGLPINDQGVVAFQAAIDGPNLDAIFLGDGGALQRIAYGGQPPDAGQPGNLPFRFNRNVALNNRDQVAFMGQHSNANTGIFRAEAGRVIAIAREDGPVPGTVSGTFTHIWNLGFAMNDRGDVAFEAWFQVGGQGQTGIFLYTDATGLLPPLVQEGTPLAGGIVEDFQFVGVDPNEFRAGEPTGLGEDGTVAFRFRLTNDTEGVAIYRIPPIFADGFETGNTSAWDQVVN